MLDLIKKNLEKFYGKKLKRDGGYAKVELNGNTIKIPARFNKIYSWDIKNSQKIFLK